MKQNQRVEALELIDKGYNQKQVSQKLSITEKTIGNWVKKYRTSLILAKENIRLTQERLNKTLVDPKATTYDIKNLVECLTELKKAIPKLNK